MPCIRSELDPRPLALLAGLWFALAIPGLVTTRTPPPAPWAEAPDSTPPCARELRRHPGIGPRRAQAIVAHRWIHGPDFELEVVPGIGPRTAEAVRASRSRAP